LKLPAKYYFNVILTLSFQQVLKKIINRIVRLLKSFVQISKDKCCQTFLTSTINGELKKLIKIQPEKLSKRYLMGLSVVCERYLNHKFNLLGSGWVTIKHGMKCNGLEGNIYDNSLPVKHDAEGDWLKGRINKSNIIESKRIWALIEDEKYTPIDWQLDFRSGYRWSEKKWYKNNRYGHLPGVEIKNPWELARMQHLPQLAIAHVVAKSNVEGFYESRVYTDEIQNQIIDFIAQNPPRYGVNWMCPMDVAIRISNWLVAVDLINDKTFLKDGFIDVFKRSVFEHMMFILENLEWAEKGRSNHYFSDIAGLIFTSVYLPDDAETFGVLCFAWNEIVNEARIQFNPDGSNYEGSTNYHRLSTEILIYSTSLVLGIEKKLLRTEKTSNALLIKSLVWREKYKNKKSNVFQFDSQLKNELSRIIIQAVRFTESVTKNNNIVAQIGDCDSGRFFKIQAGMIDDYNEFTENDLDHRHLFFAAKGLFDTVVTKSTADIEPWADEIIVSAFVNGHNLGITDDEFFAHKEIDIKQIIEKVKGLDEGYWKETKIPFNGAAVADDLILCSYSDFGLYILKNNNLFISFRCGKPKENGPSSHFHDDNLSIELRLGSQNIYNDPGSYLYTSSPEKRNNYRSSQAHNAPRVIGYSAIKPTKLLFDFKLDSEPTMLAYTNKYLVGELVKSDWRVIRVVNINENDITILDGAWGAPLVKNYIESSLNTPFSFGYGQA